MNTQIDSAIHSPDSSCLLPRHPFFESAKEQAGFMECIDAIEYVRSIIELLDSLGWDDGGLTPTAAAGYYQLSVMTRKSLSYVTGRLIELRLKDEEKIQQSAAYISALLLSLPVLDQGSRDRFLNSVANQMNTARSNVDRLIDDLVVK